MIKLLHTADLHLNSPLKSLALKDERLRDLVQTASRTALERIVQIAIDEGVRAVLIAGDLFDGRERSAKTATFLIHQFERLKAAGIAVFYIKGNHDAENPVSGAFALPDNVHVFDGRGGKVQLGDEDVWIHGVSFHKRHAPDSLLPKYPAPVVGAVNIGIMHTSLAGASGHDVYAPCSVAELSAHGYDYWALGHVHKRMVHSDAPWIVMPGMPQGRDIGEAGLKSISLITIDDSRSLSVDEVVVAAVEFRASVCDLGVGDIRDDADLRARLIEHIRTEAGAVETDAAILRLTLTGQPHNIWQIRRDADTWQETLTQLAEDTGVLWLEKLRFDFTEEAQSDDRSDAVAELGRIMEQLKAEDGFRSLLREEMDVLRSQLPPERRQALLSDAEAEDALLESLMQEAAETMLARMKGAVS